MLFRSALSQRPTDAANACELLYRMDALRRPERVASLIALAQQWADSTDAAEAAAWWQQALQALLSVDAKAVNQQALARGLRGLEVGQALKQAHIEAISQQTPL